MLILIWGEVGICKIPHLSLMAIFPFPTYGKKQILPLVASPLVVGFLFSPRLLNHDVGNGNITIRDSWGIYFSPFAAWPLIEKNPIPTSPHMRITSVFLFCIRLAYIHIFNRKSVSTQINFLWVALSTWAYLKKIWFWKNLGSL